MAARLAEHPAGKVTEVFETSATREGAFRFLENEAIGSEAIAASHARRTAQRCAAEPFVYVVLDMMHGAVTDRHGSKSLGPVGKNQNPHLRGVNAMSALAVGPTGTPWGLLAQRWWNRPDAPVTALSHRPREERESFYWPVVWKEALATVRTARGPGDDPWLVADRGADIGWWLEDLVQQGERFTIRSAHNRRLEGTRKRYLHNAVRRCPVLFETDFDHPRRDLPVRLEVRACPVKLKSSLPLHVVHLRERGRIQPRKNSPQRPHPRFRPGRFQRIEWFLLTSAPIETSAQVQDVIRSYTLRWKIEECHKTFKTGACNAESSQLRSQPALLKWWVLLFAVATRIERLKFLARNEPETPALEIFEPTELHAALMLSKRDRNEATTLSVGEAVLLIAQLGGYVKSNPDPPGSITIRRGLDYIAPAAKVLQQM